MKSRLPHWMVARLVAIQIVLLWIWIAFVFWLDIARLSTEIVLGLGYALTGGWALLRSLRPLSRLLEIAQEVQSQELQAEGRKFRIETANWRDLERVLELMRDSLKNRAESLSREREELRVLMGSISDSIVAVDLNRKPLFFNTRFSLMVQKGVGSGEMKVDDYFADAGVGRSFEQSLLENIDVQVQSIQLKGELGNRFFTVSISPLRDHESSVYGAVGIFHDITELKVAEQMRIDFVANVSHELRTPLTSIKGFADTIMSDVRSGKAVEIKFLETIERNVGRLMSLISDLLDLSLLESGDSLNLVWTDTQELTSKVISSLAEKVQKKHQVLESVIEVKGLDCDPARVEQVMVNLIENALKYTHENSRIRIIWRSEGSWTELRILDNGPGIPAEHHSRLFERFYRVDKARSREQGGTGLGLAIVKHIVQRHGGTVQVQSELGQGTEFICRFPKK